MIYAALLWIAGPIVIGLINLIFFKGPIRNYIAAVASLLFFLLALFLPPSTALEILGISIFIEPTFTVLGRSFQLTASEQIHLLNSFGLAMFWFLGSIGLPKLDSMSSIGLMIIGVLIAAISIQPFLYAGVFIELAILLAIPLLLSQDEIPPTKILPFLINQSLAFPFILLAGFLLSGINTPQTDLKIISQGLLMLSIGFAFLLSIFPLYSWAPILSTAANPYKIGFILTVFPFFGILFGLDFIDRFTFLQTSGKALAIVEAIGMIILVTASIFSAIETRLDRAYSYGLVSMTGSALVAIGIPELTESILFFTVIIQVHIIIFALWGLGLSLLRNNNSSLALEYQKGLFWRSPYISIAILIGMFTIAGSPLLALFPLKVSMWNSLSESFPNQGLWFAISLIGFWISAARTTAIFLSSKPKLVEIRRENGWNTVLILIGILITLALGLFPNFFFWVDSELVYKLYQGLN
ncbi:MAG TPA: proton-conducting transporter membrane subunit [Anaerolineales bacterium]|nr:proton-conducting transporter membrane subunit [Anaerolineales bacterium]